MIRPPSPAPDPHYAAIESALGANARGRAFLAEHARRSRGDDTKVLLGAIGRLENAIAGRRIGDDLEQLRCDLTNMAEAMQRTREAAGREARARQRSDELDALLDDLARDVSARFAAVAEATETLHEMAWAMREAGSEAALCDGLDRALAAIGSACRPEEDIESRLRAFSQLVRFLVERVSVLEAVWAPKRPDWLKGLPRLLDGQGLGAGDIDFVVASPLDETERSPGVAG